MTAVTDRQIEQLEEEAALALDHVMVGLCRIALTGASEGRTHGNLSLTDSERARLRNTDRATARLACAKAIADAAAASQDDDAAVRS